MERSRLSSIPVLIAAVFVGVTAIAAEDRKAAPSKTPGPSQAIPGGAQVAPLKGEIRLSPGLKGGGKLFLPQVSFDTVNKKFGEFSGNATTYESQAKMMPEIAKACSSKAYSVQDQVAAGCTGNDTLNQCMDKLYKHCIATFSMGGFSLPTGVQSVIGSQGGGQTPSFSTKQFQQSAQAAAAQARALSQMLTQYANTVEQNAKALVP